MTLDFSSPYGVNAHMLYDEGLEKLASIGIQWVRLDFDWDRIQPDPNVFIWSEHDRILKTCERLGMSVLAVLAYTPEWASNNKDHAVPAKDPEAYLAFVSEVVRRYKNNVTAWSIWNEPDLVQFWKGSMKQFILEFWVPGLERIRSVDADAYLVGPDLSGSKPVKTWLPMCLESGGGLLDAVTHHQYGGGDTVQGRVAEIVKTYRVVGSLGFGGLPFWITEIGWDRVTPVEQGRLLTDVYYSMEKFPWWSKTFWYDSNGQSENGQWGLLEPDGNQNAGDARPALAAYAKVINA